MDLQNMKTESLQTLGQIKINAFDCGYQSLSVNQIDLFVAYQLQSGGLYKYVIFHNFKFYGINFPSS